MGFGSEPGMKGHHQYASSGSFHLTANRTKRKVHFPKKKMGPRHWVCLFFGVGTPLFRGFKEKLPGKPFRIFFVCFFFGGSNPTDEPPISMCPLFRELNQP